MSDNVLGEPLAGNIARQRRDHLANGKDLHLFSHVKKAYVRYRGQMVLTGYHYRPSRDTTGRTRRVIVFELTPLDVLSDTGTIGIDNPPESIQHEQMSLADLRGKALADAAAATTPIERRTLYHQRGQSIKFDRRQACSAGDGMTPISFEARVCV